nr:HNH endonuclease signature motif containing protein [Propionicimonas sp.]
MEMGLEGFTDGQLLAVIGAAVDALTDDRLRLPSEAEQLDLLENLVRLGARLHAVQAGVAARVEAGEMAWHEHGTSTSTWLMHRLNLTRREAGRIVSAGEGLARFEHVARAAVAGAVLPGQAAAITSVLDKLPDNLPADTMTKAQTLMVGFAQDHNSAELRHLSRHLVEVLDPVGVEAREAERLEREHRAAMRTRHLTFAYDGQGSVLFRGSLPVVEAEPFIQIIDAYTAQARHGLDRIDPHTEPVTLAMGRADALIAMVHQHTQQALTPAHGGDRPRIVLTLSYDKLAKTAHDHGFPTAGCGVTVPEEPARARQPVPEERAPASVTKGPGTFPTAHLIGSGEPIPASVLRRWLCDADLMPIVLGRPSEILDVGRTQRLVTPPIRAALEQRDGGCVFPGCDKPPRDCHAHHILPWWAGGPTALANLVLLCPHHHGIIEPGHDPTADRWTLNLRHDGVPEIRPPARVDSTRKPRVHNRFHLRH